MLLLCAILTSRKMKKHNSRLHISSTLQNTASFGLRWDFQLVKEKLGQREELREKFPATWDFCFSAPAPTLNLVVCSFHVRHKSFPIVNWHKTFLNLFRRRNRKVISGKVQPFAEKLDQGREGEGSAEGSETTGQLEACSGDGGS